MKHYDVYGIGNALLDVEFDVTPEFLHQHGIEKTVMTLVSEERQRELLAALGPENMCNKMSGGSAANTMIALQQLGGKGFYTCKIADDATGDWYYRDMVAAGLDSNYNRQPRPTGTTGVCLVMVTEDAHRTMNTHLGITQTLSLAELDEAALSRSKYLYIEGYLVASESALEAALHAKRLAEHHGVKTALTLSDPTMVKYFKPQFQQLLALGVDFLFCNEEEAMAYTDTHLVDGAISALKNVARQFVVTHSAKGSTLFDGERLIHIPAYPVKAVDTIGAGDGYAGAFLYALTQGHSYTKAGHLASKVAAAIVAQYGPRLKREQILQIAQEIL